MLRDLNRSNNSIPLSISVNKNIQKNRLISKLTLVLLIHVSRFILYFCIDIVTLSCLLINIHSGREPSDCSNTTLEWETDTSIERCPQEDWTVSIIAAIYMLLSNLLLVNLVIAKFRWESMLFLVVFGLFCFFTISNHKEST